MTCIMTRSKHRARFGLAASSWWLAITATLVMVATPARQAAGQEPPVESDTPSASSADGGDEAGATTPADGDPGASSAGVDGADTEAVQILNVAESEEEVILEIAPPAGLTPPPATDRAFGVTDGGRAVDVTVAALDTPAVVLLIDTSGSMRGRSLDEAKTAARSFVEALPSDAAVGLVSFDEEVVIHDEPTLDRGEVLASIDALRVSTGETALWEGVVAASDLVAASDDEGGSVVALTDGENTVHELGRQDAVDRLRASATVFYAVAIESPDADHATLEGVAGEVRGQFLAAADVGELDAVYTEIAGRLANRYELRFAPAAEGERVVVVSVASGTALVTGRVVVGREPAGVATTVPTSPDRSEGRPAIGPVPIPTTEVVGARGLLWFGAGSIFTSLLLFGLVAIRQPPRVQLATASGADRLAGVKARWGEAAERILTRHDRGRRLDAGRGGAGARGSAYAREIAAVRDIPVGKTAVSPSTFSERRGARLTT